MTELQFSYSHPKFVSDQFTGKNTIAVAYAKEDYYVVSIDELQENGSWLRKDSFFTYKEASYDFTKAEEGKTYRLAVFKKPATASVTPIEDGGDEPVDESKVREIIDDTVSDAGKSGQAADVNLTAIVGLVATQVQAAIAELLAKIIALGAAISYEGQGEDIAHLPASGMKKGHMYNVVDANGDIPAGTNYVWNGTLWDPMVGQIDLSPFLKSADAATTYVPLSATATNSGADVTRLLAINAQGKAISINPSVIVDYVIKSLAEYDVLALPK
jgi:hypothetical protein